MVCADTAAHDWHRIPLDELTHKIIGAGVEVHSKPGPGLLESVYQECLAVELRRRELHVERERHVPLDYKGERIETRLKLDMLIEDRLIVEVKAVDTLHPIHQAQVVTYLKLTGFPAGLLLNFNTIVLKSGLKRLDHPDLFVKSSSPDLLNSCSRSVCRNQCVSFQV